MPLGIFGIGAGGVKSQHLDSTSRGSSGTSDGKDWRGTVVKLPNHTVTLEKRLAEGGFSVVYLVSDKQSAQYALKRQFINEDARQLEACRRECRIVNCLAGHKNIVSYVDHMILKNNCGIYECSLLTSYYKNSVLQLMNDRHLANRCLSANETLRIFCDICEAVARLHHSQTPVIHRDLKVENVLIDERRRGLPIYVLCDFGSATTKVLSLETHSVHFIEDEIRRYTTLSYRAPEMIDIYSGRSIGTKVDIWALGVMLYRLCYFILPFGESSLAIQNCSYAFPSEPKYPEELRAIIKILLEPDLIRRPDIYQVSTVAFEAIGQKCPVGNLNKVPALYLAEAMRNFHKLQHNTTSVTNTLALSSAFPTFTKPFTEGGREMKQPTFIFPELATSVNPRLRPKPVTSGICAESIKSRVIAAASAQSNLNQHAPHSSPSVRLSEAGPSRQAQFVDELSNESLKSSAFRPYSSSNESGCRSLDNSLVVDGSVPNVKPLSPPSSSLLVPNNVENASWNPFLAAPYDTKREKNNMLYKSGMDDHSFGRCFDQLRRFSEQNSPNKKTSIECEEASSFDIDKINPFAEAPFHSYQMSRFLVDNVAMH